MLLLDEANCLNVLLIVLYVCTVCQKIQSSREVLGGQHAYFIGEVPSELWECLCVWLEVDVTGLKTVMSLCLGS